MGYRWTENGIIDLGMNQYKISQNIYTKNLSIIFKKSPKKKFKKISDIFFQPIYESSSNLTKYIYISLSKKSQKSLKFCFEIQAIYESSSKNLWKMFSKSLTKIYEKLMKKLMKK